jgi:hypothetical protein
MSIGLVVSMECRFSSMSPRCAFLSPTTYSATSDDFWFYVNNKATHSYNKNCKERYSHTDKNDQDVAMLWWFFLYFCKTVNNNIFFKNNVKYCVGFDIKDTKGVIRIRNSKKNRQHTSQKKKDKGTNNDLQNIHIKRKMELHEPTKKRGWTQVLRKDNSMQPFMVRCIDSEYILFHHIWKTMKIELRY